MRVAALYIVIAAPRSLLPQSRRSGRSDGRQRNASELAQIARALAIISPDLPSFFEGPTAHAFNTAPSS
jgi:hypothetical protein